jgi:hypothetical protein
MDLVPTVVTTLQRVLGNHLDDLARQCGVVVRQRKFSGQTLLRMLVLTVLHQPAATTWDFLVTATQLGLEVSPTAVEKRLAAGQPLVDFLRASVEAALQQALAATPDTATVLQAFPAVVVGDSTTITLPVELADAFPGCGGTAGASAALKLQVLWDLRTGGLRQLVVQAGRASDAHSPTAVDQADPGTLWIYDLGYFRVERLAALDRDQAFFLSRLQHGTTLYHQDGTPLDLIAYLRHQTTSVVAVPIQLGAQTRLPCRLLALRVPEEVANRRRQQAREKARDHGREPTAEYLEWLGWSLFVTNCTAEQLDWPAVVVLYRARWQIELLFKLWKSHHGLARGRAGATPLEQLALFYAQLLGVLLQHWLLLATVWPLPRRSLRKAARVWREELKLGLLAVDERARLEATIRRMQRLLPHVAKVQTRHKHPSHAQLLNDPALLNWRVA